MKQQSRNQNLCYASDKTLNMSQKNKILKSIELNYDQISINSKLRLKIKQKFHQIKPKKNNTNTRQSKFKLIKKKLLFRLKSKGTVRE